MPLLGSPRNSRELNVIFNRQCVLLLGILYVNSYAEGRFIIIIDQVGDSLVVWKPGLNTKLGALFGLYTPFILGWELRLNVATTTVR